MSSSGLKVATFTVRATMRQSVRWKQAAEAAGHASVGTWLAEAADAHLDALHRAGRPVPLAWRKGRFSVRLEGGEVVPVKGHASPPFGAFSGTEEGPATYQGRHRYVLVFLPDCRILATLHSFRQCKALASELARLWVRWGGSEPAEDSAPVFQRFQREDV